MRRGSYNNFKNLPASTHSGARREDWAFVGDDGPSADSAHIHLPGRNAPSKAFESLSAPPTSQHRPSSSTSRPGGVANGVHRRVDPDRDVCYAGTGTEQDPYTIWEPETSPFRQLPSESGARPRYRGYGRPGSEYMRPGELTTSSGGTSPAEPVRRTRDVGQAGVDANADRRTGQEVSKHSVPVYYNGPVRSGDYDHEPTHQGEPSSSCNHRASRRIKSPLPMRDDAVSPSIPQSFSGRDRLDMQDFRDMMGQQFSEFESRPIRPDVSSRETARWLDPLADPRHQRSSNPHAEKPLLQDLGFLTFTDQRTTVDEPHQLPSPPTPLRPDYLSASGHRSRGKDMRVEDKAKVLPTRGTKRRMREEYELHGRGRGETAKRGRVIDHDDNDITMYGIPPSYLRYVEDLINGKVTGDWSGHARPTVHIQSGKMPCEEMFQHLVDHGCVDLSSRVDSDKYSSGLIHGGAFGDIWKGKLRDGTEIAVKVWRFSSLLHHGPKSMKRAMREIYNWSKIKHEHVQELMGVVMFDGRLGMVSRWMDHGNLREYLYQNPEVDRYPLCIQVATGLAYLHSKDMVHGDLKGANILISGDGVVKLSDFDHSIMSECSLAFSETSNLGGGTTRWMAPELILGDDCSRSANTDIYALGMTMLEIITGNSPYYPQCKDDVKVVRFIMEKKLPTRPMDDLKKNYRDDQMWGLLLNCWNYVPPARPKATEVVKSLQTIVNLPTIDISSVLDNWRSVFPS